MFSVGDKVVCIRGFCEWERLVLMSFPQNSTPIAWPEVGRTYTVIGMHDNPYSPGELGVELDESPGWKWDPTRFRKVTDIEEPKRIIVEVPVTPRELEPA